MLERNRLSGIVPVLSELGFPTPTDVRGRRSIADLLPKTRARCGIYLLEFSDGTFYIQRVA